ncbi:hypothetical protein EDF38_2809 [Frigoribacterium sp. PhB160]|uniref:hypothetical protein n=1 Tax=Frigoribacterium sp. PhB160 TaxID=2485192 RepID=UPI000F4AF5D4|nr:hypothetical protein [Frigoribacterium sp. PhB160]ROS58077.1 hypothetical protein EDF38_2809 [Frigoribacterium sp. PhB160]
MHTGAVTVPIPEPTRPPFVDRLRRGLDAAAAEEDGAVRLVHSWVGDESEDGLVSRAGWQTRVLVLRWPRRAAVDVWFDAHDGDVSVLGGGVVAPEWALHGEGDETACLGSMVQLVHDLAARRVGGRPWPLGSDFARSSTVLAVVGGAALVGAVVVDVLRARGRGRASGS